MKKQLKYLQKRGTPPPTILSLQTEVVHIKGGMSGLNMLVFNEELKTQGLSINNSHSFKKKKRNQ